MREGRSIFLKIIQIQKGLRIAKWALGSIALLEPLASEEQNMNGSSPGQSSQDSA